MRDIVFKALTSKTSKKQDICVQEAIERDGVLSRSERRCRYFIMGKTHVESADDIDKIAQTKFSDARYPKKHYYVLKIHDSERGEDKLFCKIAGMLYAISGNDIYCIAYVHSFKITFTALPSLEGN